VHEVLFFVGIYLVSNSTAGHKPALESFGADQFDDTHAGERVRKMSFNWWNCALCAGVLLGITVVVVVYAQDSLGWGAATLVLAAVMAALLAVFLAARRTYRYRVLAEGSPLTPPLRCECKLAAGMTWTMMTWSK
jgi:hypothetical protein